MECKNCKQNFQIKIATKVDTQGCKVLTNMNTILTLQCNRCNHVFQASIPSKTLFSIKPDKDN